MVAALREEASGAGVLTEADFDKEFEVSFLGVVARVGAAGLEAGTAAVKVAAAAAARGVVTNFVKASWADLDAAGFGVAGFEDGVGGLDAGVLNGAGEGASLGMGVEQFSSEGRRTRDEAVC